MKHHSFQTAVVLLPLLAALPAGAREIAADEASRAASNWVRRNPAALETRLRASDVAETRTFCDDAGSPLFHVARMEGGGVVTSAETGIRPIVAFFDGDGPSDDDPNNPLLAILSADMACRVRQVRAARDGGTSAKFSASGSTAGGGGSSFADEEAEWAALLGEGASGEAPEGMEQSVKSGVSSVSDLRVAKLLTSTWSQNDGAANYYTPPGPDGSTDNYVCGCVALAGAQIARFWKFPTASRPTVTRTCYVSGSSVSKTTKGGTYAWSSMPDTFSSLTTTQKQAIGKLCYDFGVATYMNWGPGGSGAGGYCLDDAFLTVFGYANSRVYCGTENAVSSAIIQKAVFANLDAKCPVSLGVDGHQVVADGYGYASGTPYTHINLGWGGYGDAWYNLPMIDATSAGYTSTVLDVLVYNIFPQKTGDLLTGRVLDRSGNPVSGASVSGVNGSTTVTATTDSHGVYALRVTGGKTWSVTASYGGSTGSKSVTVTASVSTRISGEYYTPGTGTVGNSWGNDITLGVTVPTLTLASALDNTTLSFTTGGDASWFGQADTTHDGTDAAQSGAITHNQSTWLQTTVTGPGTISFWWNVSSESASYDYLEFLVDGTQNAKIGGTSATWAQKTVTISGSGTHTLKWNYSKDSSVDSGSDCGWVDQVVWTPSASAPSAPTGVSAADGASTANCTVSWGTASGATSYTVYRNTSNDSGSATVIRSGVTSTSYADTSAAPGTLYYYWVRAVNSSGTSSFSASNDGYRKLSAPTISAATGSTTGVALSWGAVTGATYYRVFRATSSSGTKTALGSWQTGRTYTDTSGTVGTTYYYFVQAAVSSSGTRPSAYSASKTGAKVRPVVPTAPTGVSAADGASTANCTVSWGTASGATSYTVYRNTSNDSGSATVIRSGVTSTSYADTSAAPGTLYYYWVRAVNSVGTSGFSSVDSGYRKISNDAFASAIALSGYSGSVESGTCGATSQSGEPLHADVAGNSAWWTWTAPALGTMEISTAGSAFDTVLAVYTGSAVGSLSEVASNDDSGMAGDSTSRVVFETAGAGTVYRIAVAGYDGTAGHVILSWNFTARNAPTITAGYPNTSPGTFHIAFKAKKGFTYQIQRAQTLGGTWTTVKTVTPSAAGTYEADVSVPTSWSSGFFRVTVNE